MNRIRQICVNLLANAIKVFAYQGALNISLLIMEKWL